MPNEDLNITSNPDNRDALYSLFGLVNNYPSSNPENGNGKDPGPQPPSSSTSLPPIFWWKWFCAIQKNGAIDPKTLERWLVPFQTMLEASEQANRNANAAHQAAKVANKQAETIRQTTKAVNEQVETIRQTVDVINEQARTARQAVEVVNEQVEAARQAVEVVNKQARTARQTIQVIHKQADDVRTAAAAALSDSSTIREVKERIDTEVTAIEAIKKNADQKVQRIVNQVEEENHRAQEAAQTAKGHARRAEQYVNDILKLKEQFPCPSPSKPIADLMNFLKKYKFLLLFGSIALIPLLLWLSGVLPPKPSIQAYVNPITGNDANDGSATAPFRTVSHALRKAGAGSNIYLSTGNYDIDRSLTIPTNTKLVVPSFNDINGHWAAPFIQAMATQRLVAGYPDGSFRPNANLTRAEYATMLAKAFNLPEAQSVKSFPDVTPDFWAYPYIQRAASKAYLQGFDTGNFKPNDNTQRVQVIISLVSGLELPLSQRPPKGALSRYQDSSSIPGWATAQVMAATNAELIANYPNLDTFNPTQNATRAETVVMVYQALVKQGKMPAIESPYLIKR